MKKICRLDELRSNELERIRNTIRKRFRFVTGAKGNIVEIAFGAAEKNGELDPDRWDAICFYVRQKRMPRAKIDRIPKCVEVRLRRGKQFVLVCLLTDVIDLGLRQVQPSGQVIRYERGLRPATTGCVVAWKLPGQTRLSWGVLSVGHLFANVSPVPETQQQVRITSATTPQHLFKGTLLARSLRHDGSRMDASLVRVSRASLIRAALIPPNGSASGKRVRELSQLRTDRGQAGFFFPVRTRIPLIAARYLPVSTVVTALGPLQHVVEVNGPVGAFSPGRSGSLWVIAGQVACLQHGSQPPMFARSWGQSLESIMAWAAEKISANHGVSGNDVDLRLIRLI